MAAICHRNRTGTLLKMQIIGVVALALMVTAAVAATASAAQPSEPQGRVVLGTVLWTFRASAGGFSPAQRADVCTARGVDILSDEGISEKDVKIVVPKRGAEPEIWVGKYLFVTVTRADASVNRIGLMGLARIWARNLAGGMRIAMRAH